MGFNGRLQRYEQKYLKMCHVSDRDLDHIYTYMYKHTDGHGQLKLGDFATFTEMSVGSNTIRVMLVNVYIYIGIVNATRVVQ